MTTERASRGLILAAGRGSRLAPLTDHRPKALVAVGGVPLLRFQVSALRRAGVTDLAIVTGYRAESINVPGSVSFVNPRWNVTNMVRSMETAREWLGSAPCVVSYADIIYSSDAVRRIAMTNAALAIAYDPNWQSLWARRFDVPQVDAETFRREKASGRLIEIGGRVTDLDVVEGQYMGLLRIAPEAWSWIEQVIAMAPPDIVDRMDVTSLLSALLRDGRDIQTVPIADSWMEIDTPSDLDLAERLLAAGALEGPSSLPFVDDK